jgi:hypothetical protein
LRRRIAGLLGLLPLLSTLPAQADPVDVRSFGLFLGYAWGGARGLEWGIEAAGTHHTGGAGRCTSELRSGFGPVLRISMIGGRQLSLTGALHGGAESSRGLLAFDGELGGVLSLDQAGPHGGIHTGLLVETIIFNAYARQHWLLNTHSMGGGFRYMPTFGEPGYCAEGRPFRDGLGSHQGAQLAASGRFDRRCPDAQRWARRAADEHASVPAFLQLASELLQLGAPTALVERAVRAAEEELGHTIAAAALATRYGGAPLISHAPDCRLRAALPRDRALARLAHEAFLDGCVNEGLAARIAAAEADATTDDVERQVSSRIASEEASHAALSLDVLRWINGDRPELVRALGRAPTPAPAPGPSRLARADVTDIAQQSLTAARRELASLGA